MAKAPIARICECGNKFETSRSTKIFCSQPCQRKNSKASFEAVCEGCGITFRPKRTGNKRFCSRDCSFIQQKRLGALQPTFRKKEKPLPHSIVFFQNCQHCGVVFASKNRALRCKAHSYVPSEAQTRPCAGACGAVVTGYENKKWCASCRKKRSRNRFKLKHGKVSKHRHKARLYGGAYEAVNPIAVFIRDGWKCQLCGCNTNRKMRGTSHDRAPELDHIIPLSRGGDHSYINTQCSCRECNIAKGNRPQGQLLLFG